MKKYGFTLIELLAVIAIIGILALLVLPNFMKTYREGAKNALVVQENEVVDASKLFIEDYCRNPMNGSRSMCEVYSLRIGSSYPSKKYTCLSTLQETKYIEDIIFNNNVCHGFVIYDKDDDSRDYSNYKAYLECGEGNYTEGIKDYIDENGIYLLTNCGGDIASITSSGGGGSTGTTYYYLNVTTNVYYETLKKAFEEVKSGETIMPIKNATETSEVVLANGKTGVTLDLNGKKVTLNSGLTNRGDLSISGGGQITSPTTTITNYGNLSLKGVSSSNTLINSTATTYQKSTIVNNSGATLALNTYAQVDTTATCSNCTDDTHKATIVSNGTFNVSGGTASYSAGCQYCNTVINSYNMNMTSGNLLNPTTIVLYQGHSSTGTVNLTGGLIESTGYDAVNTSGNATINIDGSIRINAKDSAVHISSRNTGNVNIHGGTLIGNDYAGIHIHGDTPGGTLVIDGGSIRGSRGVYQGSPDVTVNIYGGTITGETDGLFVKQETTVTLGTNDGTVNTSTPKINAITGYGVNVANGGTFNYYDGVLKSNTGSGYSLGGNARIPDGYKIKKTTDSGIETAILVRN